MSKNTAENFDIMVPDYDNLPAEIVEATDDPYSPLRDDFFKSIRAIRAKIANRSAKLKPSVIQIVKCRFQGKSHDETAKLCGISVETAMRVMATDDAKELTALLHLLRMTEDGATEKQRLNMLWRIAVDTEKERPKTSIAAIAEMNKMQGINGGGDGGGNLTVVINNAVLGKGALDA